MRFVPVAKISFLVSFHGEVLVGWWSWMVVLDGGQDSSQDQLFPYYQSRKNVG